MRQCATSHENEATEVTEATERSLPSLRPLWPFWGESPLCYGMPRTMKIHLPPASKCRSFALHRSERFIQPAIEGRHVDLRLGDVSSLIHDQPLRLVLRKAMF